MVREDFSNQIQIIFMVFTLIKEGQMIMTRQFK